MSMNLYYVDKNPNEDRYYELHVATCNRLPNLCNRRFIGSYLKLKDATAHAKANYSLLAYCSLCIKEEIKPIPFYKRWFQKK